MLFSKAFSLTALLLIFAGTVAMQTAPAALEPRKAEVGSRKLKLEERDGKCQLLYEGRTKGEITLDVPPPCEFVRDHTGKAQHYQYKRKRNAGTYDVIIVVGGVKNKHRSDKLMADGCPTQYQAVSLSSRGVATGVLGSLWIACPTEGLDEKVFGSMAKPI